MKVAFYAPLKSPDHAVPSGDRTMARSLMAALEAGGARVTLASTLRLYDGRGAAEAQARLADAAGAEVDRLLAAPWPGWQAWITYHNYYKAPDLIGPHVARARNIPYLQIESTRARKRLDGPWARFAAAAEAASDAAQVIFFMTQRDAETLRRDAPPGQVLHHLHPFLPRTALPPASTQSGPMLSVGMMRAGDKLASYTLVADTLAALPGDLDWRLEIAGDGPARPDVVACMAPFGARVTFLGQLSPEALAQRYGAARLLLWPGVNEAFGLAYLEAQAAGVPVVAQDRPGVCDVVPAPRAPVADGAQALAAQVTTLLRQPDACAAAGQAAQAHVAAHHLQDAAARTLARTLETVT